MGIFEISLRTDAKLIIGSDTTATTLAAVTHYLTGSPRCYRRACEEVRATFATSDEICFGPQLNSCQFLRACIDEALRLSPPGGSALWREVDTGGAQIDGEFFPAGCEVGVGVYAIHHDKRYWDNPFGFAPERWLHPSQDGKTSKGAPAKKPYVPFGMGPRGCVGKPLAIAQMMLTLATLLRDFDFRRMDQAESWADQAATHTEYELEEHITSSRKGPVLCFQPRT